MNFLGMGPMELLLIIILALIVFGPAKLPEIMGQVGKAVNDFRRATTDLSEEFNKTIQAELQETRAVMDEAKSVMTDAKSAVTEVHSSVNSAVTGAGTLPAPALVAEPNGAATNGTTSAEPTPAMADTSQWSWETAAQPEPKAAEDETVVPADALSTVVEESAPASHGVSPDASVVAAEIPATESEGTDALPNPKSATARDDLAPPY